MLHGEENCGLTVVVRLEIYVAIYHGSTNFLTIVASVLSRLDAPDPRRMMTSVGQIVLLKLAQSFPAEMLDRANLTFP